MEEEMEDKRTTESRFPVNAGQRSGARTSIHTTSVHGRRVEHLCDLEEGGGRSRVRRTSDRGRGGRDGRVVANRQRAQSCRRGEYHNKPQTSGLATHTVLIHVLSVNSAVAKQLLKGR